MPYNLFLEEEDDIDSRQSKIGLNQLREIDKAVLAELPQYYEMFLKRLELLRNIS